MTKATAKEIMDEIVKHPTLDEFMRRLKPLSEVEYKQLIQTLRDERPLYIAKEAARKEARSDDDD